MEETAFVSILLFGFLMGIRHAIEPDHVIAVSTIASQSRNLWRSALAGVFWGIGHTLTLLVVGMLLILLKNEIPETLAMSLEFMVGIMLVYLGVQSLYAYRRKSVHAHLHQHEEGAPHTHFHSHQKMASHDHTHARSGRFYYWKSTLIGFIHGLAGSAAMFVLTMTTVDTWWEGAIYILVFGAGTVLGMLLFTTVISLPFVFSRSKPALNRGLASLTGLVSTVFGLYYMYDLGVTEGLFRLWMS